MTSERRRAAVTMAVIGLMLSIVCGWLLTESIMTSVTAWRTGAAEIRVSGGDVAMLVLMPIFVALGVWGGMAVFREGAAMRRIANGIAIAAMVAVIMALAGSWAFQAWAEQQLAKNGYERCGFERTGRFSSLTLCARKAGGI